MMYHYLIAEPTVSNIIRETCSAIWEVLQPIVLKSCTAETWKGISVEYERKWNFPHCCGAIDGRHIEIDVRIFWLLLTSKAFPLLVVVLIIVVPFFYI